MPKPKENDGPFDREGFASVADVARFLGLGSQAVYNLLYSGAIPHAKFGGTIRVPRKDVVEYVQRQLDEARDNVIAPASRRAA